MDSSMGLPTETRKGMAMGTGLAKIPIPIPIPIPMGKPLIPTTNPSFLQLGALYGPLSANQAEYLG